MDETSPLIDSPASPKTNSGWRKKMLYALAIITLLGIILSPHIYNPKPQKLSSKRNVIFMVSDGMGPASVAMARDFLEYTSANDDAKLVLDDYLIGQSRTKSSSSWVTDSAAGATAFSCGLKTYNGAIGVDPDGAPCGTIMEAAKLAGYKTGVVVSTAVTDATPASFISHALYRSHQDRIANQIVNYKGAHPLGSIADLVIGGGRCHFLPSSNDESCRLDDVDLIEYAQGEGWTFTDDITEFRDMRDDLQLPFLGLLSNQDFPLNIDNEYMDIPHLNETAIAAVKALEKASADSDKGFFLLVEGSRIDHCGHANDAGAQVREVMGYSEVFNAMKNYAENNATNPTIVLSTSDHETGGLSIAYQESKNYPEYLWKPEVLANAKHSAEYLVNTLLKFDGNRDEQYEFIKTEILGPHGLGLPKVSKSDVKFVAHHLSTLQSKLTKMQSTAAQVGWSTHGHSAVDVNIYGASNYPEILNQIRGGHENIELGHFMNSFLGFTNNTLSELTSKLNGTLQL